MAPKKKPVSKSQKGGVLAHNQVVSNLNDISDGKFYHVISTTKITYDNRPGEPEKDISGTMTEFGKAKMDVYYGEGNEDYVTFGKAYVTSYEDGLLDIHQSPLEMGQGVWRHCLRAR